MTAFAPKRTSDPAVFTAMRRLLICCAFAYGQAFAQASPCSERWYDYGPATVEIGGNLAMETVYGPPNYGEHPDTDSKLTIFVLLLPQGINVRGKAGELLDDKSYKCVTRIQVVLQKREWPLERLAGKRVTISGFLSQRTRGPEYTDVLLNAAKVVPDTGI